MKLLRYLIFISILVVIVPFLGVPMGWKQGILVALGVALFVLHVFLRKAILSCPHQDVLEDLSGASFKDSNKDVDTVIKNKHEQDAYQDDITPDHD